MKKKNTLSKGLLKPVCMRTGVGEKRLLRFLLKSPCSDIVIFGRTKLRDILCNPPQVKSTVFLDYSGSFGWSSLHHLQSVNAIDCFALLNHESESNWVNHNYGSKTLSVKHIIGLTV